MGAQHVCTLLPRTDDATMQWSQSKATVQVHPSESTTTFPQQFVSGGSDTKLMGDPHCSQATQPALLRASDRDRSLAHRHPPRAVPTCAAAQGCSASSIHVAGAERQKHCCNGCEMLRLQQQSMGRSSAQRDLATLLFPGTKAKTKASLL